MLKNHINFKLNVNVNLPFPLYLKLPLVTAYANQHIFLSNNLSPSHTTCLLQNQSSIWFLPQLISPHPKDKAPNHHKGPKWPQRPKSPSFWQTPKKSSRKASCSPGSQWDSSPFTKMMLCFKPVLVWLRKLFSMVDEVDKSKVLLTSKGEVL